MSVVTEKEARRRDVDFGPRVALDQEWRAYVARLAPNDTTGAFLLSKELPGATSPPHAVRRAIATASRRALWPNRRIDVMDHEAGKVRGVMRVMMPQGREVEVKFDDELGWRATILVKEEEKQDSFVVYYRSKCMNPIQLAVYSGATIDTSSVDFTPLSPKEKQRVLATAGTLGLFVGNLKRLAREYAAMSRGGEREAKRFIEMLARMNRFPSE